MHRIHLFTAFQVLLLCVSGASCSDDTKAQDEWRLQDTHDMAEDLQNSHDMTQPQGCVYEGDFRVYDQEDVQELATFPCAEITGSLAINLDDGISSISSIGNLRKVHRDVIFGSDEYYFGPDTYVETPNKSLKNIEGFQSLKYIGSSLEFYNAPMLHNLNDFHNLDYLLWVIVSNITLYGDDVGIYCSELEAFHQYMGDRIEDKGVYCPE